MSWLTLVGSRPYYSGDERRGTDHNTDLRDFLYNTVFGARSEYSLLVTELPATQGFRVSGLCTFSPIARTRLLLFRENLLMVSRRRHRQRSLLENTMLHAKDGCLVQCGLLVLL